MSSVAYSADNGPDAADGLPEFIAPVPRVSIQAFCVSEATARTLQAVGSDRRLARAHFTVQMGGIDGAIDFYESAPTPNLIMLEVQNGADAILADIARLAEVCDAGTKVILIGHVNDVLLYRELMRRGVSEYLVAPLQVVSTIETIASLYANPEAEPVGRVVAFYGAKGGCGSSSIAHNSGWTISQMLGTDVIMADLDLAFGTGALDFNQDPTQGLVEAVYAPDRLDDVMLDRLLTKCDEHFSLFAASCSLEREYDLDAQSYNSVLDVVRKSVPTVVLDVPHMWSGWVKNVLLQADEVVITAEPDLASLRNTKSLIELVRQARPNDRPPHLILNKVGIPKRPEISPKDFGDAVDLEPTTTIAFDPQLFGNAANNGQMISEVQANAKPIEAFTHLAKLVTGKSEAKREKRSVLSPFLTKLKRKSK